MLPRFLVLPLVFLAIALAGCFGPVPDPPSGAVDELVASGSTWAFLDDGSEPPATWTTVDFDPDGWSSGPALLGYGVGDEATVLRCHPAVEAGTACPEDGVDHTLTFYLRRTFEVKEPERFSRLRLRLIKDDGAIVYLNGEMVARANMRPGIVGHDQPAASEVTDRLVWRDYRFDWRKLRAGSNVFAVELHQASTSGPTVGFDLELTGFDPASTALRRGPYLQQPTSQSVIVRWTTGDRVASEIFWGEQPEALEHQVLDAAPKLDHEIRLTGLRPGQQYFYRLSASGRQLLTKVHHFTTAPLDSSGPASGPASGPVRLWVVGGLGSADRFARRTVLAADRFTADHPADLWLTLGDNASDKGSEEQFQAALFEPFRAQLANLALWPAVGNQDLRTGRESGDVPYFNLFTLPTAGEAGGTPSGSEAYYSFTWGEVHLVCLDTVAGNLAPDKEMLTWLQKDLEEHRGRWTLAYFHHPPYTDGFFSSDDEEKSGRSFGVRQNILPILESHGVDLVLSGRSPSYERSFLLHGHYGTSDTLEPSMLVATGDGREDGDGPYRQGPGGRGTLYVMAGASARSAAGSFAHPAIAFATAARGSVIVDIEGGRLDVRYLTANGEIVDHVTLLKN